jgi:hypothetical protein
MPTKIEDCVCTRACVRVCVCVCVCVCIGQRTTIECSSRLTALSSCSHTAKGFPPARYVRVLVSSSTQSVLLSVHITRTSIHVRTNVQLMCVVIVHISASTVVLSQRWDSRWSDRILKQFSHCASPFLC